MQRVTKRYKYQKLPERSVLIIVLWVYNRVFGKRGPQGCHHSKYFFTMKAFTIVLGLFAALAVSDVVMAADDIRGCGDMRAVRCIGLEGDKYMDTKATVNALKRLRTDNVCQCENDNNHLYIVAANDPKLFKDTLNKCKKYAYRGLVCKDARA
ncbi:hypothetical protein BGZ72_005815 [Mortierella alpina]|nr:hypothetical protein BGZ72_005815 [Mortierella alpina]